MKNIKKIEENLKKLEITAKKNFGQNFLISNELAKEITSNFKKKSHNPLCEIGPGFGALTDHLINTKRKLILIEKEQELLSFLKKKYWNYKNIVFHHDDVLEIDFKKMFHQKKYDVIGNLPYIIATKIVQLFLWNYQYFENLYFSFPKEIAERIVSLPKNKKYGFISVYCQLFATCSLEIKIKNIHFYPKPKIESQFVHFKIKNKIPIEKKKEFIEFIKKCFKHKRKTLINNLNKTYKLNETKIKKILKFLKANFLLETARAEELSLNNFFELFEIINF